MLKWLKLSHHVHSGKLRPHEHTSYLPLSLLLLVVGLALISYTASAQSPGPESGSIGITGTVPADPPTIAATVSTPAPETHFGTSPVKITGSCPANTLVEVFKNDIFAGSTPCGSDGAYSVEVDLLIGKNIIIARVYDALNQPGPDSNAVTIYYDALPTQSGAFSSFDFGGAQLLLNTDAVFRGVFPEQELSMPLDVLGGTPPYAINIQWGDSNNKVVSRSDNTTFRVTHTYAKAGTYQISVQASDARGRVAFITVAAIVNGQPAVVASESATTPTVTNRLLLLWPLYTGVLAVVASFWMGEWREKRMLVKRGLLSV
jgi:PKD domain